MIPGGSRRKSCTCLVSDQRARSAADMSIGAAVSRLVSSQKTEKSRIRSSINATEIRSNNRGSSASGCVRASAISTG